MLKAGTSAPEVQSVDQAGNPFRLADLRGRWVVLYFYPADETYGCTREACAFRDNMEDLAKEGAEVVGVSVQDQESHKRFAEHHALRFRLLADPGKRICRTYEALGFLGVAKRITYLIDPEGRIRFAYRSEIDPVSHVERVKGRLREMRAAPVPS
ncbi:MAG TPA: peroxiredoxin [Thermoplasmata archaeon]|nr:peroxiredoxin [Thermoplasmata archaeon]